MKIKKHQSKKITWEYKPIECILKDYFNEMAAAQQRIFKDKTKKQPAYLRWQKSANAITKKYEKKLTEISKWNVLASGNINNTISKVYKYKYDQGKATITPIEKRPKSKHK
jgi:hypothetical protein